MCSEFCESWLLVRRAIDLAHMCSMRSASLEAELLLNAGSLERQLYYFGFMQPSIPASSLTESIRISYRCEHDLGLMEVLC